MRVLLLADDCNPDWPSLPVVGFKLSRAIAQRADAVVVTHVRNREAIARSGLGRAQVEYLDTEYVAAGLYRLGRVLRGGTSVAWTINVALRVPAYWAFEHAVRGRFGPALQAGEFDVVHRVTPMSPAISSPMARWCPVPFVIGPLNGGLRWPPGFGRELRREREWLTYLRSAHRWLPFYRSTFARSAGILAAFDHTVADLPLAARERIVDFPEVGVDPELFGAPPRRTPPPRVTFLFAGRLVPYKCADVLVEAFAQSAELREHLLVVVGDGPERASLAALVRARGLEGCVRLLGWRSQAEVGELMRAADVFAFPSIRELGAGVVVEAMATGLPCVVVDYGGPGGLVEGIGVKVPLGEKPALVRGFRAELERLAVSPDLRARLGVASARRALAEYAWDAKAAQILRVYDWVLGRSAKPVVRSAGAPSSRARALDGP